MPDTASLVLNFAPTANQWQPGSRMMTFTALTEGARAGALTAAAGATRTCAAALGCGEEPAAWMAKTTANNAPRPMSTGSSFRMAGILLGRGSGGRSQGRGCHHPPAPSAADHPWRSTAARLNPAGPRRGLYGDVAQARCTAVNNGGVANPRAGDFAPTTDTNAASPRKASRHANHRPHGTDRRAPRRAPRRRPAEAAAARPVARHRDARVQGQRDAQRPTRRIERC